MAPSRSVAGTGLGFASPEPFIDEVRDHACDRRRRPGVTLDVGEQYQEPPQGQVGEALKGGERRRHTQTVAGRGAGIGESSVHRRIMMLEAAEELRRIGARDR
jgi:hypothetical protein